MACIKLIFERGGALTVNLNNPASETARRILDALPAQNDLTHSRYCGRELCFAIKTGQLPPAVNLTDRVSKFDVGYWRNWEHPESGLPGSPGNETISFYYGDELLQFQGTPVQVSLFGRISANEEAVLDELGNRIWRQGFERVRAELV